MVNGVVVEKESEMNLIILIELIVLVFLQTGKCMWYLRYFDEPKSWTDAKEKCRSLNGSIFTVDRYNDIEIQNCSFNNNISLPLWTGQIKTLSGWIEKNFCYEINELTYYKQLMFEDVNGPYICHHYCEDTKRFAYHKEGTTVICLCGTSVLNDAPQNPLCVGQRKYRVYTNQNLGADIEDCSTSDCKCMYTKVKVSVHHFILSSCHVQRTAKCGNNNSKKNLNWHEAKDFCEADQKSLLLQRDSLKRTDTDIWTGIFKEYTFVWYEKIKYTVVPINCSVSFFNQSSYIERDCEMKHPFVCKTDIPLEDDNQHNCIFSTTSSQSENITMSATFDTLNVSSMTTTDSGNTESAEGTYSSGTDIMISTLSVTENVTNPSDQKTEDQKRDTEYIIAGASAGTFVVLLVVGIVVVLARRKCSKDDNIQKTEMSKVKTNKRTTSSEGSSNVNGNQEHMYCDLSTPIEETYDSLNAANKPNRESQFHINK